MSDTCWLILSSRTRDLRRAELLLTRLNSAGELLPPTVASPCVLEYKSAFSFPMAGFLPRLSNNSFPKLHFLTHRLFPQPSQEHARESKGRVGAVKRLKTSNERIMLFLHSPCGKVPLVCYSDESLNSTTWKRKLTFNPNAQKKKKIRSKGGHDAKPVWWMKSGRGTSAHPVILLARQSLSMLPQKSTKTFKKYKFCQM